MDHVFMIEADERNRRQPLQAIDFRRCNLRRADDRDLSGVKTLTEPVAEAVIVAAYVP